MVIEHAMLDVSLSDRVRNEVIKINIARHYVKEAKTILKGRHRVKKKCREIREEAETTHVKKLGTDCPESTSLYKIGRSLYLAIN